MSNFLVLSEKIYHYMDEDNKRFNNQFRDGAATLIIPGRVLMLLNVVAIIGDSCVEFLKNRYTDDRIMNLQEFEEFKKDYMK